MSRSEAKKLKQIRRRLKDLRALHESSRPLGAAARVPGRQDDVEQVISITRSPGATTLVSIDEYEGGSWDAEPGTTLEREFPDLDAALSWLEAARGVHWSMLHEPGTRPARTLDTWPRSDM